MSIESFTRMREISDKDNYWEMIECEEKTFSIQSKNSGAINRYTYVEDMTKSISEELGEEVLVYYHEFLHSSKTTKDVFLETNKGETFIFGRKGESDKEYIVETYDVKNEKRKKKIGETFISYLIELNEYRLLALTGVISVKLKD